MIVDDLLDRTVFDHHLLVVAVALGRSPGLNGVAHHHVDLNLLSLLGRKIEKWNISLEETYVLLLLGLTP